MKKRLFIRKHLFMLFMTGLLILSTTLVLFFSFSTHMVESRRQGNNNLLTALSLHIESCFKSMNQLTLSWLTQEDMLEFYSSVNRNNGQIVTYPAYDITDYQTACYAVTTTGGVEFIGIGFYPYNNPQKLYHHVPRYGDLTTEADETIASADWYWQAIQTVGRPVYIPLHREERYANEEKGVFSVARLVTNLDTRKPLGIIKIDMSGSYFDELFTEIDTDSASGILLMDETGSIMYATNPKLLEANIQNQWRYSVLSHTIGRSGWSIVYAEYWLDSLSHLSAALSTMLIFICLSAVIYVIAYRNSSQKLTHPLNSILQVIEEFRQGHYSSRIAFQADENNEFAVIAQEYNRMATALEDHIQREYKARISQQEAELLAMQMQINPHFLYNTLNGFAAMNRLNMRSELETSIMELTELFRYTCSHSKMTTVREEFAFVQRYMSLQKLRFQERMVYTVDLDLDCSSILLPKLLVQPLAENAIIHGVEPLERVVHIAVIGTWTMIDGKRYFAIIVADDGMGAESEKVQRNSTGVGLNNIRERLHSFLPGSAFSFTSRPGTGATSAILLEASQIRYADKEANNENHHC